MRDRGERRWGRRENGSGGGDSLRRQLGDYLRGEIAF